MLALAAVAVLAPSLALGSVGWQNAAELLLWATAALFTATAFAWVILTYVVGEGYEALTPSTGARRSRSGAPGSTPRSYGRPWIRCRTRPTTTSLPSPVGTMESGLEHPTTALIDFPPCVCPAFAGFDRGTLRPRIAICDIVFSTQYKCIACQSAV